MTTITKTFQLFINARPEAVFAYVADIPRHSEWNSGLHIETISSSPVGVGSHYRTRGVVLNQTDRPNELRVTQYQPSTRFAFTAQDPDFRTVGHEFTFKAQNNGTLMERTLIVNLPPLVAFGFSAFIFPLVGRPSMNKSLAALKAQLERNPA